VYEFKKIIFLIFVVIKTNKPGFLKQPGLQSS